LQSTPTNFFKIFEVLTAMIPKIRVFWDVTLCRCVKISRRFERLYIYILYVIYLFINCSWVVTRWQYTFAHKQYIEQHKLQPNNTNNNIRTTQIQTNVVECRPCPVFASFTLEFALQLRKKYGKTSG
jgi:hypothetical protein